MMILGEQFYYMNDCSEADCDISEIAEVLVYEVALNDVNVDTHEVVSTSTVFLVAATLDDGVLISTRPLSSGDYANSIRGALVKAVFRRKG